MGVVYLGRHDGLARFAAIKTLLPESAGDARLRERLMREARAQAHLTHPNIVLVYELIAEKGELFIAMEYVEGETLGDLLDRRPRGRMPIAEALPLFAQILDALQYVHLEKIIHRDIKPSNVMVRGEQVKLADFGIALLADAPRLTASQHIVGSPSYMSPEQLQGHRIDHRSDIYSAALVLYRMLAGRPAFDAKEYLAQVHDRLAGPPSLRALVPELSAGVCAAIEIALRLDPDQRFSSVVAFREALQEGAVGFLPSNPAAVHETAASSEEATEPLMPATAADGHSYAAMAWVVIAGGLVAGTYLVSRHSPVSFPPAAPRSMFNGLLSTPGSPPAAPAAAAPSQPPPSRPERKVRPVLSPPAEKTVVSAIPQPSVDPAAQEQRRLRELAELRDEIRRGLLRVESAIRMELFTAANDDLDRLAEMTQGHPDDFRQERSEVARLRALIVQTEVDLRTRKEHDRIWASRIAAIENDLQGGRWPEAERFARDIAEDGSVPETIAARARELLQQAKEGRRKSFADTQLGPTDNTIRKPSSPPRKDR
jgi:serine/threonine-protein kinase